jgi:hypothetical protein
VRELITFRDRCSAVRSPSGLLFWLRIAVWKDGVCICFSLASGTFISTLVHFKFRVWRQLDSLLSSGWFLSCPTIECIHEVHLSIVVFSKLTLTVSSYSKFKSSISCKRSSLRSLVQNKMAIRNNHYVIQRQSKPGRVN